MTSRVIGFIVCPKGTGEPEKGSPAGQQILFLFGASAGCWGRGRRSSLTREFADGRKGIYNQDHRAINQEKGDQAGEPVTDSPIRGDVRGDEEMFDRVIGNPDGRRDGRYKEEDRGVESDFVILPLVGQPAGGNEQGHRG